MKYKKVQHLHKVFRFVKDEAPSSRKVYVKSKENKFSNKVFAFFVLFAFSQNQLAVTCFRKKTLFQILLLIIVKPPLLKLLLTKYKSVVDKCDCSYMIDEI